MLMRNVTFCVGKYDFPYNITVNVPKEAKEIANIGNDQGQFDNLDNES